MLKPIEDHIVIELAEPEVKTLSGIVLPDSAKEKPQQGKVIAVGPGIVLINGQRAEVEVKVGDTILISKYAGTEVTYENNDYLILRESDVLAILS